MTALSKRAMGMKYIKRAASTVACLVFAYVAALAFPRPLFSHHMVYQNYEIWSDQAIPPEISSVLDDTTRRLRTSELYKPDWTIRVFFCNANWRMWLYGGHFTSKIGGGADTILTRNVYLRSSDIAANRLNAPDGGPLNDAAVRPLSYFIAHEAAHIIESREFGRLMYFRHPIWLTEGYADYVGKGGNFDFAENRRLLMSDDQLLDIRRSGLYRRFQLEVSYLINNGLSVQQIFARPPNEDDLLKALKKNPHTE
ncbi:hypothetical protein ACFOLJ_01890 [Rugamonas sp. CCM 8940]|uniref:hypothetical protein n=1 Tax=Rugamonas sp. CCM 8940 TaxID=2765359 RepID=UPI0018F3A4BE|nr:hypothetical protein [Rugamonas sp. CCM 8940]MBJ7311694.1 hypothetical protein [Rugamonas sp. CCM 8940]